MFKEVKEHNLDYNAWMKQVKDDDVKMQRNSFDDLPTSTFTSYESIMLLERLRKVPEVKRQLNADW